jgi:hypothetical protein
MTNFQDVLRDVHDSSLHALKTTASLSASTVYVGNPTLYAVVNTGSVGDSTANIGFATVSISNPTLYAVVNTSAPGVSNSIVTVANPNFGIIGNVTLSDSKTYIGLASVNIGGSLPALSAGVAGIGFATVNVVNQPALVASTANIGSVSILGGTLNTVQAVTDITNPVAVKGNMTLSDSKTYIGLTTTTLGAGLSGIGFATVAVSTSSFGISAGVNNIGFASITPVKAWPDPATYIGLVTATAAGNIGLVGRTSGGLSIFRSLDIDETEEDVKTSAGQLFSIVAFNRTAAPLYLKFYNATAANVTVGSTTPVLTYVVPGNADSDGAGFVWNNDIGFAFNTAISVACTTGVADADTGAPGANDCVINLGYM